MKKEDIDKQEAQNETFVDNSELEAGGEEVVSEDNITDQESEEEESEQVEIDELADAKDKYLRLYSEFDNFRRRTAKEKLELIQTAGEKIIL